MKFRRGKEGCSGKTDFVDDGILIGGTVSDLYQSRNPYVGDISADGRSVQAARAVLGINDEALLCYGTQLQTSEEPYGWTF